MFSPALIRSILLLGMVISLLASLSGCKKEGTDSPSPVSGNSTVRLSGRVVDEARNPVAGAEVSAGTQTTITDSTGSFTLAAAPAAKERCVVKVRKEGYFPSTTGVRAADARAVTQVTLTELGTGVVFAATVAKTIETGGMRVELPAAGLSKGGQPYSGQVQAYVRYIDPTSPDVGALMPGGDMAAVDAAGAPAMLITYGAVRVELETPAGEPLQLTTGKQAQLRFPAKGSTVPTIPLWHFDEEAGIWKEEGSATLQGDMYVGSVGHFSSWNCDIKADEAVVEGTLTDCSGKPMPLTYLNVGQTTCRTDEEGKFDLRVPSGRAFTISTDFGPGVEERTAQVPAIAGRAIYQVPGFTGCPAVISGRLVDCAGNPVAGSLQTRINEDISCYGEAGPDGRFFIYGPSNHAAELRIWPRDGGHAQQQAQFPASGQVTALGDINLCSVLPQDRVLISFILNGDGHSNEYFEIREKADHEQQDAWYRHDEDQTSFQIDATTQGGTRGYEAVFHWEGGSDVTGTTSGATEHKLGSYLTFLNGDGEADNVNYMTDRASGSKLIISISEYGPVSGRIKGTFSGKLRKSMGNGGLPSDTYVQVTGTFDVRRGADLN